jgi:LacI family transcriptional regulator
MTNLSGENGIQMREGALEEFLLTLPKPAAVFGANDILAMQVLRVCRNARIKVPSEVSVIGCDNDELICQNTKPQLTSIQPNFHLAGYTAAKILNNLMRGKAVDRAPATIGGHTLFPRSSTCHLPPAAVLVQHAMDYIKTHATEGISTSDVVAHLRVSRSLLDLRFRQVRGECVMDAILATRLNAVRHALKTTDRKILAIGRECGFGNPDYLKRLFKKRFGVSMQEWRLTAAKTAR